MKKSRKLPKDLRRRKQVQTFLSKYGRDGYARAGSKGGGPHSPGSFTSESARRAVQIAWANRRARAAEQAKLEEEAGNGGSD